MHVDVDPVVEDRRTAREEPRLDARSALLDEPSFVGRPPHAEEPERERPPPRRGTFPVWLPILGVGAIVAVERLSMITFVTSAGPELLAAAAVVFIGLNVAIFAAGTAWLARAMEADRRARPGASDRRTR